jgi:hypothetical protein
VPVADGLEKRVDDDGKDNGGQVRASFSITIISMLTATNLGTCNHNDDDNNGHSSGNDSDSHKCVRKSGTSYYSDG